MSSGGTRLFCEPCKFLKLEVIPAYIFCEDCRERYCEQCSLDHAKFRVLRNHHVSTLSYSMVTRGADESAELDLVSGEFASVLSLETHGSNSEIDKRDYENTALKTNTKGHTAETRTNRVVKNCKAGLNFKEGSELGNVVDQKETEKPASVPPTFDVKVLDTDLARRIKGVSKDDILRVVFKLTLEKSLFNLSFGKKTVFECAYQLIRRYGNNENTLSIDIGRKCEIGPGFLKVTTGQAKEVFDLFKQCSRVAIPTSLHE